MYHVSVQPHDKSRDFSFWAKQFPTLAAAKSYMRQLADTNDARVFTPLHRIVRDHVRAYWFTGYAHIAKVGYIGVSYKSQ